MDRPARPQPEDRLEILLSATIFLMSAYARGDRSPRLAHAVLRYLELLADRADAAGVLGATCEQAADQWASLASGGTPPRPRTGASPRNGWRRWLRLVVDNDAGPREPDPTMP